MKKLWKKVRRGSPSRAGEASPKSGSLRGSVASLNVDFEVKEKDLGKLHKAAWIGDLSKVKQLAKKDASPLDKENRTPLHLACVRGNEQVVQELMEWRAKANIGDNQNRTPLMRAVEFQQEGCVQLMLSYQVDIDTQDYMGNMPIHLAAECANLHILAHLIAAGASLNTRNKEGFSPLHLAVRNKQEDVCRLLLKERANVNIEDTNLRTPLMYACQDGSISLVKLLLHYNADTIHKDSKGWSADDCAVIQGHHACSQLISDYNIKMNRTTPSSTPRSSLPPSVVNTPRDKDSIGMPVLDGGGDDSDNETISRASGGPGSDSWADSPDVSVADDKKAKEDDTDEEDEIFDKKNVKQNVSTEEMKTEEETPAQKINLAKFAKNIHISESDTDGESVRGSRKDKQKQAKPENGDASADGARAAVSARQTSWQSQTSGEDNSWGDSPVTPRKNSAQRVSFKRDEELSEIHDITVTESEAESDVVHDPTVVKKTQQPLQSNVLAANQGYQPSATNAGDASSMSADKMKGSSGKAKDPALMEELGISDVDDISEMSETGEDSASHAAPTTPPPNGLTRTRTDSDREASAISDIMATPRPGILKKFSNSSLGDSHGSQKEGDKAQDSKPKRLIKAPVIDSDDESSAWDTTEADNILPDDRKTIHPLPKEKKSNTSEWDSDLEDMVNPVSPFVRPTPTPPASDTIPKEVEAIVRQKQAECQDFDDDETMSPSPVVTTPNSNLFTNNVAAKNKDDDDDDDDWDSTVGAVTPRDNAGLQFKEVNVGEPPSISETAIVAEKSAKAQSQPISSFLSEAIKTTNPASKDDDEDDESAWDSEDDALPSDNVPSANPMTTFLPATSTPMKSEDKGQKVNNNDDDFSDEETETVSSWELERREKKKVGDSPTTPRGRDSEEEQKRKREEERQLAEERYREEQREREQSEKEEAERRRREREEEDRREKEERERREQEEREHEEMERKEREAQETWLREEEERREWEREEAHRQEQMLQWEREEQERQERMRQAADEMMQMEEKQPEQVTPPDTVRRQQQELNRIDEQFQRERERREQEEKRIREEEENEEMKMMAEEEVVVPQSRQNINSLENPPPPPPPPHAMQESQSKADASSSGSGVYVNIGSSTVEQIRQRLQMPASTPPAGANPPSPMSTGQFAPMNNERFDDTDSLFSENPGDERPYLSGLSSLPGPLYKSDHLLDDDALSYTSTEFEEPIHSSVAYAKDRDVLTNINLSDPSSLLKVQEHVRDSRRQLDQERNQRMVLENKVKLATKEKSELTKKVETITLQKSTLEQSKIDLEAKIRSLEYTMSDEEEKRKNAEVLLNKTKEQLARKDTQYSSELEARQRAELNLRKVQIEMQTSTNTIKELQEEKEELQRQLTHSNDARVLQEQINEDQHKFFAQQQHQQIQHSSQEATENLESSAEMDKVKAELYAFKMDKERERSRFKDELALMGTENEELMSKVEELRNDIKLNEEALAHATMQYNIQVSSLRTDISTANAAVEREKSAREKLESESESLRTRLMAATNEMDKTIRTRNEMEREHRREKETWTRDMERRDAELAMLKDNSQHLNQRLQATEGKLNSMESELHVSNTSLVERTTQLQHLKQDLDRHKTGHDSTDQNLRLEKEHNAKLQAKVENMQEKLTQHQHENLSLRQQLDTFKLSAGNLPGSDANEKLNSILTNLRADSDRAKASLEERNSSLIEQVARLKEEVRGSESRRTSQEQDLRRLHNEHSDMIKKLSHAEASLQIALRSKEQLEQETARLKAEMEKLQHRYQTTHDKSIEAQARVSELVDRLEKAENSSLYSNQQLANTSANMQAVAKSKSELDESMHQLHIDNAKLEAELKYEKQRGDMLYQDLQDSQKVRSSLEALCANLKSTSAHLEDKLGDDNENDFTGGQLDEETAARVMYESEARDHKVLFDQEMKSRSRLGLKIADLERNKQDSDSKLGMEKNRTNQANEDRKGLESLLDSEREKNLMLQKDNNTLKLHLKSAKNKIKSPRYQEFQREVGNAENVNVSTPREQSAQPRQLDASHPLLSDVVALRQSVQKMDNSRRRMESDIRFLESQMIGDGNQDMRAEMEAKYRMELNRKLEDVNRFLDSQSQMRDKLDTSRTEVEVHLLSDKRKLEEEISNLRIKFEQIVAQKDMKDMEVKRFRELYESEMKWRLRISDQLQMTMDKGSVLKSKLNNERIHRNRLTGNIGNLNSTLLSNASFDIGRVNGFHDDELSNKIKAELDRSIAKHLEAAPHDLNTPILRATKEPTRFTSSLTQANHDYIDVLKRKYCV